MARATGPTRARRRTSRAAAGLQVAVGPDGVVEGVALVDLDVDAAGSRRGRTARRPGRRARPGRRCSRPARGGSRRASPSSASCIASIGGTGPEAVPKQTSRPRRASESSESGRSSWPMLSKTTGTPAPSVSSRTRVGDVLAGVDDGVRRSRGRGPRSAFASVETVPITLMPSRLRPLREDQADPAGGGVQQDGVAGLQRRDAAQQVRRGQAAHGHRRGGLEGDGVRAA